MARPERAFALTVLSVVLIARPAPAQTPYQVIARSGTAAPGGGNYVRFNVPVLDATGRVGFAASLTGGSSQSGLFAGLPESIRAAALGGAAAPGGGTFDTFDSYPSLSDSGTVGFLARVIGNPSSLGIFIGAPDTTRAVARTGTAAPAGGNYSQFDWDQMHNRAGQVVFGGTLTGGSSDRGLFLGGPNGVQVVALNGTAAPAGGNYNYVSEVALNGAGQVLFSTGLSGPAGGSLFIGTPGAFQPVALGGTAAPGGGNYSGFVLSPRLNDAGQVAFHSFLTGGTSSQGVFAGPLGDIRRVAAQGTAAPTGGNYSEFQNVTLSGSGRVAFTALLTGGSAQTGLFVSDSTGVRAVAVDGAPTPDGVTFARLTGAIYGQEAIPDAFTMNDSGQVALLARVTGPGVSAANSTGLYAGTPGSLIKILRTGDQLDVDPGPGVDLRTVSDITLATGPRNGTPFGFGQSFADDGTLIYGVTFTDNTSAVFTTIVPVPEPAGLLVVAALAGAVATRSRRSRR